MTERALDGIVVLDLSRVLAGPWCGMVLGDLGARVIKVENPAGGDDTRKWGPPYAGGEAAYYLCANRNKLSLAADFRDPEGLAVVRELARHADVLIENFKLDGLKKFGLDYQTLSEENPGLVYCSVSGYGRTGSRAAEPGYDFVIQAEGGLMSITGEADGEPQKVGVAIADLFTGASAAQAVLAALYARQNTGRGQHIDMALLDCQIAMLSNVGSSCLVTGEPAKRYGNAHGTVVPYQAVEASDGHFVIAIGNDRQFARLCGDVLGRPEIAADERFSGNPGRIVNRDALLVELAAEFRKQPRDHWIAEMRKHGLPVGPIRGVDEALAAPEVAERGMVTTVAHPTAGTVRLAGSPLKLSDTPVVDPVAPPLLGQHSHEILRDELGWDDDRASEYCRRLGLTARVPG